MKSKIILFAKVLSIVFSSLIIVSCSGISVQRVGYTEPPDNKNYKCPIQVFRNSSNLDDSKKIGTMILYDNGFSTHCSEAVIIKKIEKEGCLLGANVVNLYNSVEPSIWGSSCFQTYADFYRFTDTIIYKKNTDTIKNNNNPKNIAAKSIVDVVLPIDTVKSNGTFVSADINLSGVLSGNQMEVAKGFLDPSPSGLTGYGIGLRIENWSKQFGFDFGFYYHFLDAVKEHYEPTSVYQSYSFNAGLTVAPFMFYTSNQTSRLYLRGGMNFDFLDLDGPLKEFSSSENASGIGFYAGLAYESVTRSNFTWGLGINYEYFNPKFKGAKESIDAGELEFRFTLGLKL